MPRIGKNPSIKFEHREVKVAIRPRGNLWRADFLVPGSEPPRRWPKAYATPEEAKEQARIIIDNAINGIDLKTAHELTVDGLGRLYVKGHHGNEGSAKNTVLNIELAFRRLSPIVGHITLENLTTADFIRAKDTFQSERLGVGSRRNYLTALRSALNWAMTKEGGNIVSVNITNGVALPKYGKGRKRMYIPSPQTMAQVLDLQAVLPGTREQLLHQVISTFLSETGARISECLALLWSDIDRANRTVTLSGASAEDYDDDDEEGASKTATSYRTITIGQRLIDTLDRLLSRWQGNESPIFVQLNGVVPDSATVRRRLSAIGKHLGLPKNLRPHLFRHFHARILLAGGRGLHYVKERLGHADIKLTSNLYGHLVPGDGRDEIDAINDAQHALRQPQPVGPLNAQEVVDDVLKLLRDSVPPDGDEGV